MERKIVPIPIRRTMRKSCVLLILALFSVNLNAQVTVAVKNQPLKEILKVIETKSEYRFFYNEGLKGLDKITSLELNNATINQAMTALLSNTGIGFKVEKKNLIVLISETNDNETSLRNEISLRNVTGIVIDQNGAPIIGASILDRNTKNGTISDVNGNFTLKVSDKSTLVISYIGYSPLEVKVGSQTKMTIKLNEDVKKLDEVVVVGYGTQKKTSSTASVSAVKGTDVARSVVANISGALAGNVAGISMRPNGGQPGYDNPDLHIRGIATTGNNNPLVVIDGVIRNNINEVSPEAIESVSILKDAAAVAPYGLGGANGVILITTKKGQTGEPVISLNSYFGFQTPTYFPKMLNAQDYMRLSNEAYLNNNPNSTNLPFSSELITNYNQLHAQDPDKYPTGDALSQTVNKRTPMSGGNIQLSGGTKDFKYYAGLGVLDQKGMFDPVNYRRYTYNINLNVNATKTTNVSLTLNGSVENTNSVDGAISTDRIFRAAYKYVPTANLYYSNGLWGQFAGNSPIGMLNAGYFKKNQNTTLSTIAIQQTIPFIDGLSIKGVFSWDPTSYTTKGWHTPFYYYSQNLSTQPYTYTKQISTNEGWAPTYTSLSQEYYNNQIFTYQGMINYHHAFGKHDITGLLVAEARNNTITTFGASRNNYSLNIDELSLGSSNKLDFNNSGSSSTGSQIGYVYRVNYNYNEKYMLEASGRYDGHYYFAPNKRWGFFPAVSAGWMISNEEFLKSTSSYLDKLKIRGSWGKAGNLAGTAFQYMNGYSLYGNVYAFGSGTLVQGSYVAQEANPNITWEISTKSDIGFEASFWNNLLRVEADYFFERRTGMLLAPAITVPQEYGINLSQENAGIMNNHGLEFVIGTQHKFKNGIQLGISGNFSYSKNSMEQIYETTETYNNPNRRRTSNPFGTQFGYHALGLFTSADDKNSDGVIDTKDGYNVSQFGILHPGDIKYADISGPKGLPDGKIDANDENIIGKPVYPEITYGITPTLSWNGVDLSLFFQGAALSSLNTIGFQTVPFWSNNSNSAYEYYNNRWTADNQNAQYPRATQSPTANNTQTSDFWMKNTGYLRLKTIVLGYTLPSSFTQQLKIKKIRLYLSGQNVFTISKLDYMDPEIGYSGIETAYPTQKVFTVSLNATF